METNITESNKIIAEFMGAELLAPTAKYGFVKYPENVTTTTVGQHKETYKQRIHAKNLEYHSSFDWLMPVVDKIESLGYWSELMSGCSTVFSIGKQNDTTPILFSDKKAKSRIDHVYDAVIQFIKWYNSNIKE